MDQPEWEQLKIELHARISKLDDEIDEAIEKARSDSLVDELAKIVGTMGKIERRLDAIESRLDKEVED